MTTNTATHPVEDYLARVLMALGDLPSAERDDLVEDLDLHLREVAAETDGLLEERLGSPEAYAAELRTSAGLSPALPRKRFAARPQAAIAAALRHPRAASVRAFLDTLRPGWWVLRGYLVVAAPSLLRRTVPSSLPIPNVAGPWFGAVLVGAAVAVSVWLGLRRPRARARSVIGTANVGLVVLSVVAAAHVRDDLMHRTELVNEAFASSDQAASEYSPYLLSPQGRITNIYPYDAKGHPLTGVRLYDESGNPINLPTQPDLYGRGLVNQFTTTPNGKKVRNAYPVRQVTVPSGRLVRAPSLKPAHPTTQPSAGAQPVTPASPRVHVVAPASPKPQTAKRTTKTRHRHRK